MSRHRVLIQCLTLARLLTREPWQDVYALAAQLGVSRETILRHLAALRAAGIATERRTDPATRMVQYRVPRSAWRV